MKKAMLHHIVSFEYMFLAVLTALFFVSVAQFDWWWLVVLFLVFDISMVGYIFSTRAGGITYNLVHSLVGPALLMAIYIATDASGMLFVSLLWLFHIFVDRALGYGLKHSDSFYHTHLGKIGSKNKNA